MEIQKLNDTAQLFQEIRKVNKLTQTALAERIKSNASYLSLIESGKKTPSDKMLKKLADTFSIDLEECLALKKTPLKSSLTEGEATKVEEKGNVIVLEERKNNPKPKRKIQLDNLKDAAALFREVREANNLTIAKLRKEIGSSVSYLSQVENGKKIPGEKIIRKLAEKYNLPVNKCLAIGGFSKGTKNTKSKNTTKKNNEKLASKTIQVEEKVVSNKVEEKIIKEDNSNNVFSTAQTLDNNRVLSNKPMDETINFQMIARGEVDLSTVSQFQTELMPILDSVKNDGITYEFTVKVPVENGQKKSVLLTISNNTMSLSLEK